MYLTIGSIVRVYYDEDTFDQGCVCSLDDDHIDVDFCDWIERWAAADKADFVYMPKYFLQSENCFSPSKPGVVVVDFQLTNQAKLLKCGVHLDLPCEDTDAQ